MKTNNLVLAAALIAAVTQTVSAISLVSGSGTLTAQTRNTAGTLNDASTSLSFGGAGAIANNLGLSTTSANFVGSDDGNVAQLTINSVQNLQDGTWHLASLADITFTLNAPAVLTITGGMTFQALSDENTGEAPSQMARVREQPNVPNQSNYLDQDYGRSFDFPGGFTLNAINETSAGFGVTPAVGVNPPVLGPGVYRFQWSNFAYELDATKGGPNPFDANFQANGNVTLTLTAVNQTVPESTSTLAALGLGLVGLAIAGRRFGQANA